MPLKDLKIRLKRGFESNIKKLKLLPEKRGRAKHPRSLGTQVKLRKLQVKLKSVFNPNSSFRKDLLRRTNRIHFF